MARRNSTPLWLVPACVAVVLGLYLAYLQFVAPKEPDTTKLGLLNLQHLLLWSSAGIVLNSMMLWCLGIGLLVLHRYAGPLRSREGLVVYGLLAATTLVVGVLVILNPDEGFGGGATSKAILRPLFLKYPVVKLILGLTNVLGALVLATLIAASILVARATSGSPDDLGERSRAFRALLYSAGVMLGGVLYEVFRLYDWAASVASAQAEVSHEGLASSLTFATGLIFSAVMAAIFLPSAMQLERQEEGMILAECRRNPRFERSKWALAHGIPASPLTALGSYVAVLIPMMTGILTKVLESWVSP